MAGKCFDDYFWYAPGCRADPGTCVVWLTGGSGWGLGEAMLRATVYNMPLAAAVASNSQNYAALPLVHDVLLFWWVPDTILLYWVVSIFSFFSWIFFFVIAPSSSWQGWHPNKSPGLHTMQSNGGRETSRLADLRCLLKNLLVKTSIISLLKLKKYCADALCCK